MSLAALFCIAAAFSPISWLEYYMALEVPYMALVYVAFSCGEPKRWLARAASLVLVSAFSLNIFTRLFEPALYYGIAFLGSLLVLAAVLVLIRASDPLRSKRELLKMPIRNSQTSSAVSRRNRAMAWQSLGTISVSHLAQLCPEKRTLSS